MSKPARLAGARPLRVMKFGGTSVGTAERLLAVAGLIQDAVRESRVIVVASAMAGVTQQLIEGIEAAVARRDDGCAESFRFRHEAVLGDLGFAEETAGLPIRASLAALADELAKLLAGVRLLGVCPAETHAAIASAGERASCVLLHALFSARKMECVEFDPRSVVSCEGDMLEANAIPGEIRARLAPWRSSEASLALLPGFFGGDSQGRIVLLGRGGSDLTAALAAAATDADMLEIWTDVDGIFTADPRLVPDAIRLGALSYDETMELAHFGANVLHPRELHVRQTDELAANRGQPLDALGDESVPIHRRHLRAKAHLHCVQREGVG